MESATTHRSDILGMKQGSRSRIATRKDVESNHTAIIAFVLFIPLAIYALSTLLLPPLWGDAVMAAIGLAALAIHRPCIRLLAQKWKNNRYENMERYLK